MLIIFKDIEELDESTILNKSFVKFSMCIYFAAHKFATRLISFNWLQHECDDFHELKMNR